MIACTGSVALDTTRTPFKTAERVLGGSASYFSYCASFFTKVAPIGAVGEDFPEKHFELFKKRGIDTRGIERKTGKTLFFDSSFGYDFYARTANELQLNVYQDYEPKVPEEFLDAQYVYLGTIVPAQQLKVLKAMEKRKFSFMDTIEYYIETDRKSLEKVIAEVDGIVLNDVEARMLTGESNLVKAGKKILKMGPKMAILKKGEHGSILLYDGAVLPFPAFPLEDIVDPTGAGDSFAGGFMGHVARKGKADERTLREAMAYGNVMGSFVVEDFSLNRLARLGEADIEKRFGDYKKMMCMLCEKANL